MGVHVVSGASIPVRYVNRVQDVVEERKEPVVRFQFLRSINILGPVVAEGHPKQTTVDGYQLGLSVADHRTLTSS